MAKLLAPSHDRCISAPAAIRRAMRPGLGFVVLAATLAVLAGGCASLSGKSADDVISARQMSLRGIEAMDRQRYEEAESHFSRAVATCPTDERARCQLAEILWRRGDANKSIEHMEEAVRLSGGDSKYLVRTGEMHLARGDLVRAATMADEAIRLNRQTPSAWALKGDVLRHQGKRSEALAAYHRALSYQEHYPAVQLATAEIYRQMGKPQRTLGTLEVLVDQYPPGQQPQEVLFYEGLALKSLGRFQDAADALAAASRRGPASPDVLYHLGEAQMLAGDPTNARLAVMHALSLAPQHRASLHLKTQLESGQQRMSAAVDRPLPLQN